MKSVLEKGRVTAGQDVLKNLITNLGRLGTPPLGPRFAKISGTVLADALVVHRLTAKFETPKAGQKDVKKHASIQKMLDYDSTYPEIRKGLFKSKGSVSHFLESRAWLHKNLKGYKLSYDVEFPSGESVNSSSGYVDMYYKLISDEQWSVSASCSRLAARVAYNNSMLKRIVKQRFNARPYPTGLDPRPRWVREARENKKFIGLYVFERMFLSLCEIVGYSRVTTVPKNNKEDRVITCDPTWNLVVQRSIAIGILRCVFKNTGVDIQQLQEVHHKRISEVGLSTIDLSKASDSNWYPIFQMLFPESVKRDVAKARTGLFAIGEEFFVPNQLAPMGCGFTFEIMSVTLMAYARVLDPKATVFGDDIIVDSKKARELMRRLTELGWKINTEKTFCEGGFRESCGGFYDRLGQRYLVSHDLFFPETLADIISATNKLFNILNAYQVGTYVRNLLLEAYVDLLKILPRVAFTEVPLKDGEESELVRIPKGLNLAERFTSSKGSETNRDYQRTVVYGKRLVYSPSVELKARRDDVPLVLFACYLRNGVTDIGPRTGELKWKSYISF